MTDAIQLISIAILASGLAYCLLILGQNLSANRLAVAREAAELDHLNAVTGELIERQRVKKEIEEGAWNGFRKFRVSKSKLKLKTSARFTLNRTMVGRFRRFNPASS